MTKTYFEYRKQQWTKQPKDVDFGNSTMKGGAPLTKPMLNPKPILFYKDTWHCPDAKSARELLAHLCAFEDTTMLQWSALWVHVDFQLPPGQTHILPGQVVDTRQRYRGKGR